MLTFMLFYCWQKSRNSRVFWCVKFLAQKSGRVKCLTNFKSVRMIIFKRPVPSDDHLQEAWPFGWSIAIVVVVEWLWIGWIRQTRWILWIRSERSLRMIICKRLDPWDVRLQEACSFGWSFARSRPLRMMISKRSAPSIDHLQEAGPFGWSFAILVVLLLLNDCELDESGKSDEYGESGLKNESRRRRLMVTPTDRLTNQQGKHRAICIFES